jgi:hypothetical protein
VKANTRKFTPADNAWWSKFGNVNKWLERLKEWGFFDQPTDTKLARWLQKHSTVRKDGTRVYKQFDEPHFHDKGSRDRRMNGDGRRKQGDDGGYQAPKRSMDEKRRALEDRMLDRLACEKFDEAEAKFKPIRLGVTDPFWADRPIEPAPHHWPNLECFSENGGDAGAGAKTQIAEEDFKPAQLPSESELQFWNGRLNNLADVSDGCIVRQDSNGNLTGTKLYAPRTTTSPQRQEEMDQAMERRIAVAQQADLSSIEEVRKKVGEGVSEQEVGEQLLQRLPERLGIMLLMDYGLSAQKAGEKVGKSKEAMKKMRQRDQIRKPIISEASAKRDPRCHGWHIVVKLPSRPAYLCKLDVRDQATDDEMEIAVNVALHKEGTRLFMNAIKDAGIVKTMPNNKLNDAGKAIIRESWERTCKAFHEGMIFFICCEDYPKCNKPECKDLARRTAGWRGLLAELSDAA